MRDYRSNLWSTIKVFVVGALSLCLFGCVTTAPVAPVLVTNVVTFHTDSYLVDGSISVVSLDPSVSRSLEFASYKKKFESHLSLVGYTIESDVSKADYIAVVAYGIGDGNTQTSTVPTYGKTGGGTTTSSSGTTYSHDSGNGTYSGTSYIPPTYGVTGIKTVSATEYTRNVALDVLEANSFRKGYPKKIYELRARSTGSCNVIVEVFDEILEAMFRGFPGENGRNRIERVPGVFNC